MAYGKGGQMKIVPCTRHLLNRVKLILPRVTKKHYNQLRVILSFTKVEL